MKHKIKIISLVMTLAMVFALIPALTVPLYAAAPTSVFVGGTELVDGASYTVGGVTKASYSIDSGSGVGTLTLTGLVLDVSQYHNATDKYCSIYADGNLIIVLDGTNTITAPDYEQLSIAVYVKGNLDIEGTGTLNATGGKAGGSYGILASGDITISGGTINATGREGDIYSYGIYGLADISISGSSQVVATGGPAPSESVGICSGDNITIEDGVVTVEGGEATVPGAKSYGIYGLTDISISGSSEVTATGGDGVGVQSFGIYAKTEGITISGGTITATGGDGGSSFGIYAKTEAITISGGTITATGGDGFVSTGIYGLTDISISGSSQVVATGGPADIESYGINAGNSITFSGGAVTARGMTWALYKAPTLASGVPAIGSSEYDGSAPVPYVEDDNSMYKWFKTAYLLTFDANGGSGTMAAEGATAGKVFTLPANTFIAPSGKQFKSWAIGSTDGTQVNAEGTHSFSDDTTVYAIWADIPTIFANPITVTYTGIAVADSAITGTATFGGDDVAGTWSFDGVVPVTAGTHTVSVLFTPMDTTTYATVEASLTLTVNKSTPTGTPSYIPIIQSGKTLADAALTVGTIAPAGTIDWNSVAATEVVANKSYGWTFTPTDTANYNTLTGSITPYLVSYYTITSGADGSWEIGTESGYEIICDGDYTKFTGIKVDGAEVGGTNYTSAPGSTVITLRPSFLDTLALGKHTLELVYTDASVKTEFTILAAGDPTDPSDPTVEPSFPEELPKTGEATGYNWLFGLILILLSCVAFMFLHKPITKRAKQ